MLKLCRIFCLAWILHLGVVSDVKAQTIIVDFDSKGSVLPSSQGWSDFTSNQAFGQFVEEQGITYWEADGSAGRAQWRYIPSALENDMASKNGWRMSWTSKIVSGQYITDYYSNGTKRFLPVLSKNSSGELIVTLSGAGTFTLASDAVASAYNDYEVIYNPDTGLATFTFNDEVITSTWEGEASSQNMVVWGNGSSTNAGIARYELVNLTIFANRQPNSVLQWDTSSLEFDGSTEFLAIDDDISTVSQLSAGAIYTEFRATGTTATIFSLSNSSEPSSEFALVINSDGTLRVHARENGTFINDSKTPDSYNDNQEHKAVILVNDSGTKIAVDGSLVYSGSSTQFLSAIGNPDSMNIGRNFDNSGGQWYFSGGIGETRVYAQPPSVYDALVMTSSEKAVASYDARLALPPTDLGWQDDTTNSAFGELVGSVSGAYWVTNGAGGRAEWEVVPTAQLNEAALQKGWKIQSELQLVSGSSISTYYANGIKRFLVQLSINANGDLIADVENGSSHTLITQTGDVDFHSYEVRYNPSSDMATFRFNGNEIETWSGSASTQNVVVWGNGSSSQSGTANYKNVRFSIPTNTSDFFETTVFEGGAEGASGMSNYRIPSIIQAIDDSLLAFIEGRPNGADPGAPGLINVSFKRSTDNGRSWSPVEVLAANPSYDYSDPRPLVDSQTGSVFVFYTQWLDLCAQNFDCIEPDDPNYLIYRKSDDNGVTWGAPVNISAQVKDPTWRSINAGPGHGIQLEWQTSSQGGNSGRLIFPAIVRASNSLFYVASIYSDDNGVTWNKGSLTPISGPTEADIVELTNGELLLSARNDGGAPESRYHFVSSDGGETWVQTSHNIQVSRVDTGITRYKAQRSGDNENRIIVSAPIGNPPGANRNDLGIWSSFDEGATFQPPLQVVYGYSAYSDIITMNDGSVGIIYEATGNTLVKFINLDLEEIE
ncbi:exo-alpha-sialidase [Alteromonas sp. CNT1-28]|uniref:exo-alpha-sialidase n=1 Tax=Alteromonas sp. CNT1-28 TaxID=2917730 RepID=UPI0014472F61|nr:exo-alpha-sialidase [Alteromonas sp. CNT1-28]MCG7637757.1 exo-alpha-sialidase [Alteromonas sp. CNT1-28]NKX19300.1 hypothetical protein [Alteromonadaceae bacterium A_SAG8]